MAQSPHSRDPWALPPGWGWAGHTASTSPASSSSDSSGSSCPGAPTAPGRARPAPRGGQRRSASEREKLRMRTLARALLRLRRYLPRSVAPAGQSLTKIETLRLAIRYIGHLSAVLGLSDARLQQQQQRQQQQQQQQQQRRRRRCRAGPEGCPLCPGARAPPEAPVQAAWGGPAPPQGLGCRVPDVGPWVTPPYGPGVQTPSHLPPDTALWTLPQACAETQTSPEPGFQAIPWTPPPASLELTPLYQDLSASPELSLPPEACPSWPQPQCQQLQTPPQWHCWELSSGDQGPGPACPRGDQSWPSSSSLRLSGHPELWPEDLEGTPLGVFY